MYPRTVTERIIELQAKGFSAEETRQAILEQNDVKICVDTIYKHRKGAVSREIADETLKQQQRSILKQDNANPELAMKFRNELLKLLIPQRIVLDQKTEITENVNINATETTILLARYENYVKRRVGNEVANLQPNSPPQPLPET